MSFENSNDTIGNRIRDLQTCSAVPQPTAPPRAPLLVGRPSEIKQESFVYCLYSYDHQVKCFLRAEFESKQRQAMYV